MDYTGRYAKGNASEAQATKGWFVGPYIAQGKLEHTEAMEAKWSFHKAGEARQSWLATKTATTITIIISGKEVVSFPDGDVVLEKPGDYAIFGPNIPHAWKMLEDSTVITFRFPLAPDDTYEVPDPRATGQ